MLVLEMKIYGKQVQFDADNREKVEPTYSEVGLDVGLNHFYTDDKGNQVENPRFYRRGEKALDRANRNKSRKYVKGKKPQSKNYHKARKRYALKHLKISRKRKDHAVKLARCVVTSNDVVAYEDLRIANMVKNHNLAKSITDAGWYQFRVWLEYFGFKFGKITQRVCADRRLRRLGSFASAPYLLNILLSIALTVAQKSKRL